MAAGRLMPGSLQIRWIVAGLIVAIFPLVLWWVGTKATDDGLGQLQERGADKLDLYRFSLQGELEKFEFLPHILAQNKEVVQLLQRGESVVGGEPINRYLERFNEISGASDTYVMDRSGLTLAASNWNTALPFVGKRFAFRPYFQEAMKGHAGRYYALGTTSQRRGFYFSFPVQQDQAILGVVVLKVSAERLERLLSHDTDTVIVTDAKGVIFLSTKPDWVFRTVKPLDPAEREQLRASRQYSDAELLPLPVSGEDYQPGGWRLLTLREPGGAGRIRAQSTRYLVQTSQVPYANWIIHLLTDTDPVERDALIQMILAAVLMAALVLASGFLYQRRVNLMVRMEFQRRAREALEQSEANTRSIISSTQAGLVTIDTDGRIDSFNPTAELLFNVRSANVVGQPFTDLISLPDGQSVERWMADARQRVYTQPEVLETVACRTDGTTFAVEMAVSRMSFSRGERFLVTLHDLTERKRAEEALRRAHDQMEERVKVRTADLVEANRRLQEEIQERKRAEEVLRQAQDELVQAAKLAAIGQMSAGITHELNQPLAAIRSYADNARVLLERQRRADAVSNLGAIVELTDRMAEITGHLKAFARRTSGEPVPVSLGDVVDYALGLIASHTRMDLFQTHREAPEGDVRVLGDPIRLEQVILNLLQNALDAMAHSERRELFIGYARNSGKGILTIRDTGSGIAEDQLAHIFDPFFTTKEVGEGLGLGLSISYGIVRDYGGALRAANHPEGGSIFTVELPLAEEEAPGVAAGAVAEGR